MITSKILLLTTLLLVHLSVFSQGFPPASVNVTPAAIKTLAPTAWISGTVVSPNDSQIAAEVSGRLISLAELGTVVNKGDVIAQIDDKTLQNQRREDAASVENAQANLKFLASEVKRKTVLVEKNLVANTDLDKTVAERDIAKGQLAIAKARLAQSEQNVAFTQLKAPFDGIVAQRLSNLGEFVKDGTAIVRLVENKNLEASLYAPITAYPFLKPNNTLEITSPLGQSSAAIKSLIPVAGDRSHLMEIRLDMSTIDWPVGLQIKAAVASGNKADVLAVPRDALVLRREGMSIFRINSDNIAEQIPVTVGLGAGEYVQVIGNVNAGDMIVIRGAERLNAGQTVQIKQNNQALISGNQ